MNPARGAALGKDELALAILATDGDLAQGIQVAFVEIGEQRATA